MPKILTPAQRKKAISEISAQVTNDLHWQITDLEHGYDGGWLNSLQDSILESVSSATIPLIKKAIESWEGQIERQENERLKKLEAENRELKKDLKKYAAIQKVIDDASQEVS